MVLLAPAISESVLVTVRLCFEAKVCGVHTSSLDDLGSCEMRRTSWRELGYIISQMRISTDINSNGLSDNEVGDFDELVISHQGESRRDVLGPPLLHSAFHSMFNEQPPQTLHRARPSHELIEFLYISLQSEIGTAKGQDVCCFPLLQLTLRFSPLNDVLALLY